MKLFSYWRSSAAYRVRIALNLKGLDYQVVPVHLLRDGGEQFSQHYQEVNPQRRVPALQLDEGQVLTQSLAIIEYLDESFSEPPLIPANLQQRCWVRALAQLVACDIHPLNNLRLIRYLETELEQPKPETDRWYRHWLVEGLTDYEAMLAQAELQVADALSEELESKPRFSHGDCPTLADICLIPQLYNAHRFNLDMTLFPRLSEIERHCSGLDAFVRAHPSQQIDAES